MEEKHRIFSLSPRRRKIPQKRATSKNKRKGLDWVLDPILWNVWFFSLLQAAQLDAHERQEKVQQEMMAIQIKYQREIDRLEKELQSTKKQLLLTKDRGSSGKKLRKLKVSCWLLQWHSPLAFLLQRSLIDMYSEVLDELNVYDKNYNIQDQLPRVSTSWQSSTLIDCSIVVNVDLGHCDWWSEFRENQCSGNDHTSSNISSVSFGLTDLCWDELFFRFFSRGAGEMMTRSPVKVTLSEGPYHIATFKDSSTEYDLAKESDVRVMVSRTSEIHLSRLSVSKSTQGNWISNASIRQRWSNHQQWSLWKRILY